jgi:hypothetical protein
MGIEALHETTKAIAQLGRFEDDFLAHVAKGEMVVPGDVLKNNPKIKKAIFDELKKLGVKSPSTYIVGSKFMRINPLTGQPEFFLKKIFQRAKKAVRDVGSELKDNDLLRTAVTFGAPFLIPGLGTPIARNLFGAGIGAISGQKPDQILKDLALQNVLSGGLGAFNAGEGNRMAGFKQGIMGNPYSEDFSVGRSINPETGLETLKANLSDPSRGFASTDMASEVFSPAASSPGLVDTGIKAVKNFMVNPDETGLR